LVWDEEGETPIRSYFAGLDANRNPQTWFDSKASFVEDRKSSWNFCIKYEGNND
jgi:hypothetical protein